METCALRCNRLSPQLLECLQFLKFKFHFRQEQLLNFTQDLVAPEEDYNIEGHLTDYAIRESADEGKWTESGELLANQGSPASTGSE
jgi:hypothetical protein